MTKPGYVNPASPGWWVRTNRVGVNANSYGWEVTAVGGRSSIGVAAGTYGWVGTAVGTRPLVFVNANAAAATSVAIGAHLVGDLIVIFASNQFGAAITVPAAGGTVPTFSNIDNTGGIYVAQAVATATNHTTGTWTGAAGLIAVVLRGQGASPIGGHALSSGSNTTVPAPSIVMTDTSGASVLLHYHATNALSGVSWSAAPAGYTRRAAVANNGGFSFCVNTKDVTTSDGAVSQGATISADYGGATVEILT